MVRGSTGAALLAVAVGVAVAGCGARAAVDAGSGAGGTAPGQGGGMGGGMGAATGGLGAGAGGSGTAGAGGAELEACTLALVGPPMRPFPNNLNYARPNMAVRETAAGEEMLLHMWQYQQHVIATLQLTQDGVGDILVQPSPIEDGATTAGMIGATATAGTQAALFSVYPPHALAVQRISFDGTNGPVVPLAIHVGPVAFGGHIALANGPAGAEQLVTYNHFTPVGNGNGPHLEPRVALFNAAAQLTHGPAALATPPEQVGTGGSLSSLWIDDHALSAVTRWACSPPETCGPAVAVHRVLTAADGQLNAATAWTQQAPNRSEAALATRDGRVWLALFDGQQAVAELTLWELAPDGAVVAGPVTVDTGQTPGSPAQTQLGWGGPGLQLTATPWGLVASAMKLTELSPPSGAQVVAELGLIQLSFDLTTLSPPITIPIIDPSQQSPPRVAATADGMVAVWQGRGLPEDAPFGPNDGGRIHLARLTCQP